MLAGITFLHLFVVSHDIHLDQPRVIKMYCDNLALVQWIQQLLSGIQYPRMYLKPEADVILQIQNEISCLRNYNIYFELEHVHGHQDKHTDYQNLSRPAQLNVAADSYATNYLEQHGPQYDYVFFPSNSVSVFHNSIIITRRYKYHARQASRSPALRHYLLDKFQWHTSILDTIWWQVHGSSIQSFARNDRRRIRKFIFRWLPTNSRLHRQDKLKTVSDQCVSCNNAAETHMHILRCSCVQRSTIKHKWFDELKAFLSSDKYAPEVMNHILYNKILSECYPNEQPTIPDLPPNIQLAYNDQQQIGWHQLLCGRLAFRWGTIVATHLSQRKIPEKEMTALIWGRTLNKMVFQLVNDLWLCRNTIAHKPNDRNESILTRQRILAQIEALQTSNPLVRSCDRHFIFQPIAILDTYSLCNLISWHRQAVSILKCQKKYATTQQDIRTALNNVTNTNSVNSDSAADSNAPPYSECFTPAPLIPVP